MSQIVKLYVGDPRCEALFGALAQVIYERTKDNPLPVPSVLGVLELLKLDIIENAKDQL